MLPENRRSLGISPEKVGKICQRLLAGLALVAASGCSSPETAATTGTLVWSDEFEGAVVDTSQWTFETGNNGGWGNSELEFYQAANSEIRPIPGETGRALVITAKAENVGGQAYTSSRLKTQGKASWTYGRIEARMKLPQGQGIWPAFWMLGESVGNGVNWPACGEIDIMEMVGGSGTRDQQTYGTLHWSNASGAHAQTTHGPFTASAKLSADFHVYAIDWTASQISWSVDGTVYETQSIKAAEQSELRQPQFLLLNLAVGGQWPGNPDTSTVFPQEFWVDWIRVYQNR